MRIDLKMINAHFLCYNEWNIWISFLKQLDKYEFGEVMDVCSNKKKMIAPIIITVIMVLYYVVYFGFLITLLPSIWKYALGIIPLGFSVVMVKVCIERINEIKKGEEDDISKYWLY